MPGSLIGDLTLLVLGVALGATATGLGMLLAIASGARRPRSAPPDPEPGAGIVIITPEHLDAVHAAREVRRRASANGAAKLYTED